MNLHDQCQTIRAAVKSLHLVQGNSDGVILVKPKGDGMRVVFAVEMLLGGVPDDPHILARAIVDNLQSMLPHRGPGRPRKELALESV